MRNSGLNYSTGADLGLVKHDNAWLRFCEGEGEGEGEGRGLFADENEHWVFCSLICCAF